MARIIFPFFKNQPPAFFMIFLLEIWERFGFYTVQGIIILYFIRVIGFSEEIAYFTFGAFFALIYGIVVIGGYLGDKILGTKRTIILGLFVLALGYLSLALASKEYVFLALGTICVGNGLFKANPSNLLSKCYEKNNEALYSGFTLYYMAINLGALMALFVGPYLTNHVGYSYAYFVSFVGICLGIVNYFMKAKTIANINTEVDLKPLSFIKISIILLGIVFAIICCSFLMQHVVLAKLMVRVVIIIALIIYFFYMFHVDRSSMLKMLLALLLMIEAVVFFTLYQQMPTSLNLFAVHNVHPYLFGIGIDPQSFQALNPLWIILLSPFLAFFYHRLEEKGYLFPVPYKFALGMTSCAFGFLVLYCSRYFYSDNGIVSSYWLVSSYFFQSLGELLVSALGVAMVAQLVPSQMTGFVMGMWFLTSSIAGFIGASVASYTALPKLIAPGVESLMIYTKVFLGIGLTTLAIAILLWCLSPILARLSNTAMCKTS